MRLTRKFQDIWARFGRISGRRKRARSDEASIANIDSNARPEARERQSASDASHRAAGNPTDQGGEG
jgi:hypothetical protein